MQLERKKVTTAVVVALSLLFAHLPNTSAPAATYCIGPAAYPPDLPDCLDPVVEAQKEAKRVADEQKAAADAAALKAQQDKEEQDAIAASVAAAKSQADLLLPLLPLLRQRVRHRLQKTRQRRQPHKRSKDRMQIRNKSLLQN